MAGWRDRHRGGFAIDVMLILGVDGNDRENSQVYRHSADDR